MWCDFLSIRERIRLYMSPEGGALGKCLASRAVHEVNEFNEIFVQTLLEDRGKVAETHNQAEDVTMDGGG